MVDRCTQKFQESIMDFELTEAHATKALKNRQYDHPAELSLTFNIKDSEHEDEYQCSLSAHHHELCNHMREKNLCRCNSSYPASIQKTLHSLDDQNRRSESHSQEEDNTARKAF